MTKKTSDRSPPGSVRPTPLRTEVVVVAGHAIYQHGHWHGGQTGNGRFYEQHVQDGLDLARDLEASAVIFSGGHTRGELECVRSGVVTNSEAQGMLEYSRSLPSTPSLSTVLLEGFARDSFENVFFSLLCFHERFATWPERVHVVSWPFKALRFYVVGCGLGLSEGRFEFHGSGHLDDPEGLEAAVVANASYDAQLVAVEENAARLVDPLHRGASFAMKRWRRTPRSFVTKAEYLEAVRAAYDSRGTLAGDQTEIGHLIGVVRDLEPGEEGWRQLSWPWELD